MTFRLPDGLPSEPCLKCCNSVPKGTLTQCKVCGRNGLCNVCVRQNEHDCPPAVPARRSTIAMGAAAAARLFGRRSSAQDVGRHATVSHPAAAQPLSASSISMPRPPSPLVPINFSPVLGPLPAHSAAAAQAARESEPRCSCDYNALTTKRCRACNKLVCDKCEFPCNDGDHYVTHISMADVRARAAAQAASVAKPRTPSPPLVPIDFSPVLEPLSAHSAAAAQAPRASLEQQCSCENALPTYERCNECGKFVCKYCRSSCYEGLHYATHVVLQPASPSLPPVEPMTQAQLLAEYQAAAAQSMVVAQPNQFTAAELPPKLWWHPPYLARTVSNPNLSLRYPQRRPSSAPPVMPSGLSSYEHGQAIWHKPPNNDSRLQLKKDLFRRPLPPFLTPSAMPGAPGDYSKETPL